MVVGKYPPSISHGIIVTRDADIQVTDNTNADSEVRSKWVELATRRSVPIRCVLFTTGAEICQHNDAVRALNNVVCDYVFPNYSAASYSPPPRKCRVSMYRGYHLRDM